MTKAELIERLVASVPNLTKKQASQALNAVFETMAKVIKEEGRFSYPGFGTFRVKHRAARRGYNPRAKAIVEFKASKTVGFKPAPSFKKQL